MTHYIWMQGAIAQMESTGLPDGSHQAVLHPRLGKNEVLGELHQALTQQHITHFVRTEAGREMIVVPQIKDDAALLSLLHDKKWSEGDPIISPSMEDAYKKPSKGVGAYMDNHSTMLASVFFNMANAFWIVSGVQRAKHNKNGKFTKSDISEMMVGISYCLGDGLLAFYADDKKKPPLIAFADALSEHLHKHGVELPKEITPDALHKSGVVDAVDDFLRKHVMSIKSATKVAGGAFMMHAAIKPGNLNEGKFATGVLMAAGWLATLVLDKQTSLPYKFKEDSKADSHIPKWLRHYTDNPRKRITAPLTVISSVPKVAGSIIEANRFHGEVRTAKKALAAATGAAMEGAHSTLRYAEAKQYDYVWNLATTASMHIGTTFFAKSGDKMTRKVKDMAKFEQDMLMVSANMLAHIPERLRAHAIEEAADYISDIKGVKETKEEIAAAIAQQTAKLCRGAFAGFTPSR